jgi:hypothetical protein
MSPATHALDRRLHDLRSSYEAVRTSLAELEGEHIYALLVAGHAFSGATADAAAPVIGRVADLRDAAAPLAGALNEVFVARSAGQMDDRRAAELVAWLNSPTVMVPPSAPGSADRPLVPAPHGAEFLSAQGVLEALDAGIVRLRELIAIIDDAWQRFSARLEKATAEAAALAEQLPGNRTVAAVRTDLELLATRVVGDPLGSVELLERAEEALAAAEGMKAESLPLQERLEACRRLAREVEGAVVEGRHGLDRSRAEFVNPEGMLAPLDTAVLTGERGLLPWLGRLERLVDGGEVQLATTGIDAWQELAERTLAAARQVAEANVGPTKRRRELQGLLRAARVKAGASGRAEDSWASELAARAEAALAIPCNLAEAEAHVDAFLDDLRLTPTPAQGGNVRIARARAERADRAGRPGTADGAGDAGVPGGGAAGAGGGAGAGTAGPWGNPPGAATAGHGTWGMSA